jgi:PhnB protein
MARSTKPKRKGRTTTAKAKPRKARGVLAQPKGYHSLTPYLVVRGANEAIAYYTEAFGAKEKLRMDGPDGRVGHAELRLGDSVLMLADEDPMRGIRAPVTIGGTPVTLHLYVKDVDKVFKQALAAGGKVQRPVQDQFYGDRLGVLEDPFGHTWSVATHTENVPAKVIARRAQELAVKGSWTP